MTHAADPAGRAIARYYDLDPADDQGDVDMYLAFAEAAEGPILELAAGSGRICVPLAAAGHQVWAVDRDPFMLERAATRWAATRAEPGGELHLVEADLTQIKLEMQFGLVILAFNSLVLVGGRAEQRAALATIASHLAEGGRAVIDTWLPAPEDLTLYDGQLTLDWLRHDAETDEWVAKSSSARYEPADAIAEVTTFFDAWHDGGPVRRTMRRDAVAFLTANEIVSLAEVGRPRARDARRRLRHGPLLWRE